MTALRAKFSCKDVRHDGDTYVIEFVPVFSGSEENREFFKYTPAGNITLGVVSSTTARQIEVGRDYYVDFTPAEEL